MPGHARRGERELPRALSWWQWKWMDHKMTESANLLEETRDTKGSAIGIPGNLRITEEQPKNQAVGVT